MLSYLKDKVFYSTSDADKNKIHQVFDKLIKINGGNTDPWGLNLKKAKKSFEVIHPLFKNYFKVRIFGKENVEDIPYMVVANHSGQIAIDGMLISTVFATEISPPRILRSMVERFFTGLPFIGTWAAEGGAVLGDRQNCKTLLEKGQSVLIFPEGVRGVAKDTENYYQLQNFTRGFFRLALSTGTKILPLAVVGAEETFPFVFQAKKAAKLLGIPALPLSLNYIPLPSPIDIHIGSPIEIPSEVNADSKDEVIDKYIYEIESVIKKMTADGLKSRRKFWANVKQSKS